MTSDRSDALSALTSERSDPGGYLGAQQCDLGAQLRAQRRDLGAEVVFGGQSRHIGIVYVAQRAGDRLRPYIVKAGAAQPLRDSSVSIEVITA